MNEISIPPGYKIISIGYLRYDDYLPSPGSRAAMTGQGRKWIWKETATGRTYQDGCGHCYDPVEAAEDAWRDYKRRKEYDHRPR